MAKVIDIEIINLISEYLKNPTQNLYSQISQNKIALEYLETQQMILGKLKEIDIQNISESIFLTIEDDLIKIYDKSQIFEFFKNLKNISIIGLAILIGSFAYFTFNDIFNNENKLSQTIANSENFNDINSNIKANINSNVNSNVNSDLRIKNTTKPLNTKYVKHTLNTPNPLNINDNPNTVDAKNTVNIYENIVFLHLKEDGIVSKNEENYFYSGNIKNYKTIEQIDSNKNAEMLRLAEKEIINNMVNLKKIDDYIYKTILTQHQVDVIINKEILYSEDK